MARQPGKNVIAAGVETAEQSHFFCEVGYDGAQGFYFAKPMRAEELESQAAR
jgi:EAL domain-containing protein (putative c-di-GMP-specific phosphodiesterase class I)